MSIHMSDLSPLGPLDTEVTGVEFPKIVSVVDSHGAVPEGGTTSDNKVIVSGTSSPAETLVVIVISNTGEGGDVLLRGGKWSFQISGLRPGETYQLLAIGFSTVSEQRSFQVSK
ncbi:hypothetical protein [Pseudomonas folii]|uniref:Head decoration protein n=1 Tax=Pseudomonas folii TaxID=2762593 RepID=A0ABR7B213_9PSED|nr:hypothetical protein [Pseudomonas folii]MBC3950975.1 hypothetical protein [Pseudomonas folii]